MAQRRKDRNFPTRTIGAIMVIKALQKLGAKRAHDIQDVYRTVAKMYPRVKRCYDYQYGLRCARRHLVADGVMRRRMPHGMWQLA